MSHQSKTTTEQVNKDAIEKLKRSGKSLEPQTAKYRVKRRLSGYEPQMLYTSARGPQKVWYPLNESGYWLEPDAYSDGIVTRRMLFYNRMDAERVLLKAKSVNQEHVRAI